jgi:hypothetical protein
MRPRYTAFQSIFRPGQPPLVNPGQGILGVNAGGPQAPGFVYPQAAPTPPAVNPAVAPTGVHATFGNLGHWYTPRAGYYGNWYPNGIASGAGILGASGYGAPGISGAAGAPMRQGPSFLGTTLMGAATVNQFRR